jgi:hypothetical protein
MNVSLLDQFVSHTTTSTEIPYCQIISPPNLKPAELDKWSKKDDAKIGFFIKHSEAEKAGFSPDENWEPFEASLGDGTEVGYICSKPKFCIVHKSQREVQYRPTQNDRFSFVGLAWEHGADTEHLRSALADGNKLYKVVTRYLILFLGADGKPLHNVPIQYTAKGAFAGSLYAETNELYKQVSKVYFQRLKQAGKTATGGALSPYALAFAQVNINIGWARNKATESPFCVPNEIVVPTIDNIGKDLEISRPKWNRNIVLHGVALEDAVVNMESEAGGLIKSWYEEYKDFPKPRRQAESEPEAVAIQSPDTYIPPLKFPISIVPDTDEWQELEGNIDTPF